MPSGLSHDTDSLGNGVIETWTNATFATATKYKPYGVEWPGFFGHLITGDWTDPAPEAFEQAAA